MTDPIRWYVKVRDFEFPDAEDVADFAAENEAERYKARLLTGSGGLFGLYHDVWISATPELNQTVKQKVGKKNASN